MIITIDGPAGSGKSAAALRLARRLDIRHLDTGAMYRAVALDALQQGIIHDPAAMSRRVAEIQLDFDFSTHPAGILLAGQDVSQVIRTPQITQITRCAADNPAVRASMVQRQRLIAAESQSLVTEGRDQGTVAFPRADFKFYLDADPRSRAHRRFLELTRRNISADENQILLDILQRDQQDRTRPVGALIQAPDAIIIDTTLLTLEQVVDAMAAQIEARRLREART